MLRLYYDLDPADHQLQLQLCDLACSNNNLDLCNVRRLPGTPVADASSMFPMIWRFLPTLDPQVLSATIQHTAQPCWPGGGTAEQDPGQQAHLSIYLQTCMLGQFFVKQAL